MSARDRQSPAADPERGSVTLFALVAGMGLLLVAGLVVDGGAKIRGLQRADRIAAEAARTAGQVIDSPAAIDGQPPTLDAAAAAAAAQRYLAGRGVTGTVTRTGGRALAVTVTVHEPTVFLGLIGIRDFTVTGSAEVLLVPGISGAQP